MTVSASPADLPPGTASESPSPNPQVGKGQTLLNVISALQTAYNNAVANSINKRSLADALNQAQIQAVDYFMGSFWVSADQIIAQMYPADCVLPKKGDPTVTSLLAQIAARLVQLNTPGNVGMQSIPPGGLTQGGIFNSQYSTGYPAPNSAYPLTEPDVLWYQLNTELVDYMMRAAILPASLILSTMTGAQTYPWNGYWSNYTFYQQYWDGVY